MIQPRYIIKAQRQQGAVLIVSIIMLLIMTALALSSVSTSTVQRKMARNAQDYNRSFQASESAVANLLGQVVNGNLAALNEAMTKDPDPTAPIPYVVHADITSTSTVAYNGKVILSGGNSMDADKNTILLSGQRFEFRATSELGVTKSTIVQGIDYN